MRHGPLISCGVAAFAAGTLGACDPATNVRTTSLAELKAHARFDLDARASAMTLTITPDATLAHVPGEDTKPCLRLGDELVVQLGDEVLRTTRKSGLQTTVETKSLVPPVGDTSDDPWSASQPYRHGPSSSSNGSGAFKGWSRADSDGRSKSHVCGPLAVSFSLPVAGIAPKDVLTLAQGQATLALPIGAALASADASRVGEGDVAVGDEIQVEVGTRFDTVHWLTGKLTGSGPDVPLGSAAFTASGNTIAFRLGQVPAGKAALWFDKIDLSRPVSATCGAQLGCAIRVITASAAEVPLVVADRP